MTSSGCATHEGVQGHSGSGGYGMPSYLWNLCLISIKPLEQIIMGLDGGDTEIEKTQGRAHREIEKEKGVWRKKMRGEQRKVGSTDACGGIP